MIAAVAVLGLSMIGTALGTQQAAPEPTTKIIGTVPGSASPTSTPRPSSTDSPSAADRPQAGSTTTPKPASAMKSSTERLLIASRPVHLSIPAIKVSTGISTVGLTAQGVIDVPKGKQINQAAWYDQSPTPGQFGASIIVGHIDTEQGPSVFFELGGLKPGNLISLNRADGRTGVFIVDGLEDYPDRSKIPPAQAYIGAVDRPELRLITCANFDNQTGHYRGNIVVFAHLKSASG